MIHNEMSFLFGVVPTPGTPAKHLNSMVKNNNNNSGDIFGTINNKKYDRVYKDSVNGRNNDVVNEIQDTVYASDRISKDPYVALLDYFNDGGGTGKHGPKSMELKAADFAYLKDLGVYPINRLIILRRFRDGVVVPNNLSLFNEKPISTVIGWVKYDESNKEMFSFNFNEKWTETTETLDKVIQRIMKEQFNIKTEMFLPVPAWSQGFLFGMLNKMGLTDYTSTNVPTGDPNVLRTSMMREVENQGLLSELKITFETSYEQKYIDGIDPSLAIQDIITNLTRMGTSDMKFILNGDSQAFKNLFGAVLMGGNGGDTVNAWIKVGKTLISNFMDAVSSFFKENIEPVMKTITDSAETQNSLNHSGLSTQETKYGYSRSAGQSDEDRIGLIQQNIKSNPKSDKVPGWNKEIEVIQQNIKTKKDPSVSSIESTNSIYKSVSQDIGVFVPLIKNLLETVLSGTIYKYRWPLIGSIGVMSGLSTTPWHLTVGNPFSPILNMSNIIVNNVDLKPSNEMGFNDMPKRIDVTIDIKMGRSIGASEINKMFNNQYGRIYTKNRSSSDELLKKYKPTPDSITTDEYPIVDIKNIPPNDILPNGVTKQGPWYIYPDGSKSTELTR